MIRFSADWVLPISDPPINGGVVAIEDGLIVAVGGREQGDGIALGRVAVLPGLVNAHTHLELSYLKNRIPPAERFLDWVRHMLAARSERGNADNPAIVGAAREAIQHARAAGTSLIGDVTNTLATIPLLRDAGMPACVFHELLGFSGIDAEEQVASARHALDDLPSGEHVRSSLSAHAPYSVSQPLFAAIRRDLENHAPAISCVHLGESPEEVEFLATGGGGWRKLLQDLGVWNAAWEAPGCSPVDYLADMGFIDRSVLAVHGVQLDGKDLDRLRALGTTLVSCPRSNRHVGVGSPPLEAFYAMKVDVAFGTDSLASVADLNLFAELAEARRIAPKVPARALLRSATLTGATALGFGPQLGSIEPGKQASLITVRVPDGISDVEEYLVSGIEPSAVRWLAPTPDSRHSTPNQ